MIILYGISVLGSIICFIMVLIRLFKAKGALHGILGLICSLYTFIWGWINAKTLGLSKLMLIWTACLVGSMVTGGAAAVAATAQIQKMQMEAEQQAAPVVPAVPVTQ